MRYLLDTQLLIWYVEDDPKLTGAARSILLDREATLFFSVASIWEVSIKSALNKADFAVRPEPLYRMLRESGWNEVAIQPKHVFRVLHLPLIHRDPFDRMLVAQASVEDITLLTADKLLTQYDAPTLYVG